MGKDEDRALLTFIQFLLSDNTPIEEVKEILRIWPDGAMNEYLRLREIYLDNIKLAKDWDNFTVREKDGDNKEEA